MGYIAAANTLSDLYAMGVVDCANMLMLLAVPIDMPNEHRDIVVHLLIKGFVKCCSDAGTSVSGGQTVLNPWLTIGGVASSVCANDEFVAPNAAVAGDVVVLTKPLGTQVAVNAYESLRRDPGGSFMKKLRVDLRSLDDELSDDDVDSIVERCYLRAVDCMTRLNRTAARLMHKYNAHAATDVTGFGILGHATNLIAAQKVSPLQLVLHKLPVIRDVPSIARVYGRNAFGLMQGRSAETSGGLLVVLSRDAAASFCRDIEATEGYAAWIVGVVEKSTKCSSARLIDQPRVIEVPQTDTPDDLW